MATKINFEEIFGIYRDDNIADFANLDNDTKLMLYSELYKWTQKCLSKRSGNTSIYGRVLRFTQLFEGTSSTNSEQTAQEKFKRITNEAGLSWGDDYYPDIENINFEREQLFDTLKRGFVKPAGVTPEIVDEDFSRLLEFSSSVEVIYDRLGIINKIVVDNPMDAARKLDTLKALSSADSEEVKKIEEHIESYQYDLAIKEADSAINKARKESKKQAKQVNESVEMPENPAVVPYGPTAVVPYGPTAVVPYEEPTAAKFRLLDESLKAAIKASISTYSRLIAISRDVRTGLEYRGIKYKNIAVNIYDFIRYNHEKYSALINLYNEGMQKDGSNIFLQEIQKNPQSPNAILMKEFIQQMDRATDSLLHNGVDVNAIVDKSGKLNKEEISKLEVKTAGNGRATKEELLAEAVKIYKEAKVLVESGMGREYDEKVGIKPETLIGLYSRKIKGDELVIEDVDKLTEKQVRTFHEDMIKVSDSLMAVSESPVEESKEVVSEVKPAPSPTPAPAPKKEDAKRTDESDKKKADGSDKSKKTSEKTDSKDKKGALVIEPKPASNVRKRRLVDPKKVYNAPGMDKAVKVRGYLHNITFLLRQGMKSGTKYPERLGAFYDKYYGMLLKNDSFWQEYVDNMKHGNDGIEMTPERVADIRLKMQNFIADMQEVEEEFKSRKIDMTKLIDFEKQKDGDVYPVWNEKELKKFINAYSNALDDAEMIVVPNPMYPDTNGLVRNVSDRDAAPAPRRDGLVPTRPNTGTSSDAVVESEHPIGRNETPVAPVVTETPVEPSRTSDKTSHVSPATTDLSDSRDSDAGYNFEPIRRTRGGSDTRRRAERTDDSVPFVKTEPEVVADDVAEEALPELEKEGLFKRFGKWIARRPVWTATILFAGIAIPVASAFFLNALPSVVVFGAAGLLAGNLVKAAVKGISPRYSRFIHKYDVDKRKRKLAVDMTKKRQLVKEAESILNSRSVAREDIRAYAEVERGTKPKRTSTTFSDLKDFVKGKRLTAEEKLERKAEREDYKAQKQTYKADEKAGKQISKLRKSEDSNLRIRRSDMDLTGLDADQIREIVRLGSEIHKLDDSIEKGKRKVDKKYKKVLKSDERIGSDEFEQDAEDARIVRNSGAVGARQSKTAEEVKDMSSGVINTRLGRYIDSKVHGYGSRTKRVEKQVDKTESKLVSMIERKIENGDVQGALDYVAKDMQANDGVVNDTYVAVIREKVAPVGEQYIRAKFMETDGKLKDSTASKTILEEVNGGSSKEKSNREMAALYGKYYYGKGMTLSEVQEATKGFSSEVRAIIIQAYKDIKRAEDRFM